MSSGGAPSRRAPQFTPTADRQIKELTHLRDAIAQKVRELCVGDNAKVGKPLTGELMRCRRVSVGAHHRLVYWDRGEYIAIIAIGLRKDDAVYDTARRSLARERNKLPPLTLSTASPSGVSPAPKPPKAKPKKRAKRRRR